MNQEDIFRLLLLVLLVANRQLSDSQSSDNDNAVSSETSDFSYTLVNDLLILAMATGGFADTTTTTATTDYTFSH